MRSQRDQLLYSLRIHPERGLCAVGLARGDYIDYLSEGSAERIFIGRAAARIHELRQMGYRIETRPCTLHQHRSRVANYRLEGLA